MNPHAHIRLLMTLICACVMLLVAPNRIRSAAQQGIEEGEIKIAYDPARNETNVVLSGMKVFSASSGELYLYIHGRYLTRSPETPPQMVYLGVTAFSPTGFRFPDVSALTIVADGKRLRAVIMPRFVKRMNGREFVETMMTVMRYESFEDIAYAKILEMRLHDTDFNLNATQMRKLHEFVRLLDPTGMEKRETERNK